jgi:uncharacterized membrane protein
MADTSQGTGLQQNVAGMLSYLLTWVTGIVFYLLEPNNKFVRFHAVQSIVVFGAISILYFILWFVPVIGWVINIFLGLLAFILWIVLMVKAYLGQMWKVPVLGDIAEKWANK